MGVTKIEYLKKTWNPVEGCSPVSEGCANCWARTIAERFHGGAFAPRIRRDKQGRDVFDEPRNWTFPQRVGVCFTGDLFHDDVETIVLVRIFDEIERSPQHTWLLLTKRPRRMLVWALKQYVPWSRQTIPGNIWWGFSAENQTRFDERWAEMKWINYGVRAPPEGTRLEARVWLSYEPALGPLVLPGSFLARSPKPWVVCGAEQAAKARPMEPEWAEAVAVQCHDAGVPFYFKQASRKRRLPWCDRIKMLPEGWKP